MPRAETLSALARDIGGRVEAPIGSAPKPDPEIRDVTHASQDSGPGTLFVAIPGARSDGHHYVEDAVRKGAPAVCVERPVTDDVPQLLVTDTRAMLGPLAAIVHGNPSQALDVVGVTGTDGKTTVTHYIKSILDSAGIPSGLVGTISTRIGDETVPSTRTTPEASDFQRLLARMRRADIEAVAAEVSSHALALHRVAGTRFSVAAFTNLSQDHLDFHGDMDSYLGAKAKLFTDHEVGTAVVNIDDPAGRSIADMAGSEVVRVGTEGDVRSTVLAQGPARTRFALTTPWGEAEVEAPVVGDFNVLNAVIAAGCCLAAGVEPEAVIGGLEELEGVPGRFEVVSGADPVRVIVDYAHTPRSIALAIQAARHSTQGSLVALAGAGGDRDVGKRPLMGQALSGADLAVVTSDNPRSEPPEAIVSQVAAGLSPGTDHLVEIDRAEAIREAIASASPGDTVLIMGRGHEPKQEIAGETRPFDDRRVAREMLEKVRSSPDSASASGSMAE